ncbi:ATP-binding protein [Fodinisporobacter ferrooxydans]|uniref:histidine kinase n=1 Tax=Fodinisporobacter ferrooxydans TaxID=2901836 RepID=A0ABY4CLD3_9BACL|nr:ATP-binding protein [Alicyclobacillaceae bacterium MYW30-H2]
MLKENLRTLQTAIKELADINTALDESLIVAITDQKGTITFANEKFCKISKYSKHELLGQNHRIINSGLHSKDFFRNMWRTIANGKIWRGEIRNKAKDGTFYWMDTTIVPCLNAEGKPYQYVSFRIDITERKMTEEYLRRSDKIAAVGQMASGIAHEIRNPLAAIKWTIKLMQAETGQQCQSFDMILSEINRIDSIVTELLSVAKPQKTVMFSIMNIQAILETTVLLMNIQAVKHRVHINLSISEDLPNLYCDENQLKQVFINLIKNAFEAMPNGGELTITAEAAGSDYIRVRLIDQGCGIPAEQIAKLGEPFYTTKEKGTGLGLMICQKIIQDHQGTMQFKSELGKGTTIDIDLPVYQESSCLNTPTA